MEIVVLGSGTSHGVPMIGCDCSVCRSANPKNKRTRPSIVIHASGGTILVDTTPELRLQAVANEVKRVDAVLLTHTHADHIMGMDDLRRFNDLQAAEIPVYGDAASLEDVRRIYSYIFRPPRSEGGGQPRLTLHEVAPDFELCGLHVRALTVMHGSLPVLAYRFEERIPAAAASFQEASHLLSSATANENGTERAVAYVTDVNSIPPDTLAKLYHLDLLVLDAVRPLPHSTHFGLQQALDVIAELKPRRALLTHLSHQMEHDSINAQLPAGVELAYDGQRIRFQ